MLSNENDKGVFLEGRELVMVGDTQGNKRVEEEDSRGPGGGQEGFHGRKVV